MNRLQAFFKRDGWLLMAIVICAAACLLLGASGDADSAGENRISRVLSRMEGAGQVEVAVHYEDSLPCGAVAVADGAGSIAVQLRLTDALSALLGLAPERIAVYPRQPGD